MTITKTVEVHRGVLATDWNGAAAVEQFIFEMEKHQIVKRVVQNNRLTILEVTFGNEAEITKQMREATNAALQHASITAFVR